MSDIRAQSRRDAEFDRLLDRMDTPTYPWVEPLVRDAYEMGKRHGDEALKANLRYAVEVALVFGRALRSADSVWNEGDEADMDRLNDLWANVKP